MVVEEKLCIQFTYTPKSLFFHTNWLSVWSPFWIWPFVMRGSTWSFPKNLRALIARKALGLLLIILTSLCCEGKSRLHLVLTSPGSHIQLSFIHSVPPMIQALWPPFITLQLLFFEHFSYHKHWSLKTRMKHNYDNLNQQNCVLFSGGSVCPCSMEGQIRWW